jgi:hypothetical protein
MVTGGLVKLGEAFENSVYKLQLIAVAPADMEDARVRVGPWTGARSEREEGVCCCVHVCRERRRHDMDACMDADGALAHGRVGTSGPDGGWARTQPWHTTDISSRHALFLFIDVL